MVTLAPSQSYFLHVCMSINRDTPREIILLTPIEPKQCWESTDRRTKSGCRKEQEPDPGSPLKSQSQFFKLPIRATGRIKYEQQWLFWLQPMQSPPRFLSLHIRMVDWGSSALEAGAQRAGRAKRNAAMNCFMLSVVGHDYVRTEGIACVEDASQESMVRSSQEAFIDFSHGCNYRERISPDMLFLLLDHDRRHDPQSCSSRIHEMESGGYREAPDLFLAARSRAYVRPFVVAWQKRSTVLSFTEDRHSGSRRYQLSRASQLLHTKDKLLSAIQGSRLVRLRC